MQQLQIEFDQCQSELHRTTIFYQQTQSDLAAVQSKLSDQGQIHSKSLADFSLREQRHLDHLNQLASTHQEQLKAQAGELQEKIATIHHQHQLSSQLHHQTESDRLTQHQQQHAEQLSALQRSFEQQLEDLRGQHQLALEDRLQGLSVF